MIKRIVLMLTTLASLQIWSADNCSVSNFNNIDLNDKFCELRDQDSTGWCYAFAAADLLDFNRSNGKLNCSPQQRTSPASLAVNYVELFKKNKLKKRLKSFKTKTIDTKKTSLFIQGGMVSKAVMAAYKNGICSEAEFPSEDFKYVCEKCDLNQYINLLLLPKLKKQYNCRNLSPYKLNKRLKNMEDIKNFIQQATAADLVKEYENQICSTRLHYAKPKKFSGYLLSPDGKFYKNSWSFWSQQLVYDLLETTNKDPQTIMLQQIDNVLDKKKPVAISISSIPLFNGDTANATGSTDLGMHAVLLTGKKCIKGKQYYLIRNSWGHTCSPYKASVASITQRCLKKLDITAKRKSLAILKRNLTKLKKQQTKQCNKQYQPQITSITNKQNKLLSLTHISLQQNKKLRHINQRHNKLIMQLRACRQQAHQAYANTYNTAVQKFNQYLEICHQQAQKEKNRYYNPNISCHDGIIQVLASELKKNLYGIDYFE